MPGCFLYRYTFPYPKRIAFPYTKRGEEVVDRLKKIEEHVYSPLKGVVYVLDVLRFWRGRATNIVPATCQKRNFFSWVFDVKEPWSCGLPQKGAPWEPDVI
jgi:hypothetical protein